MKEIITENKSLECVTREFESIGEFYNYISSNETNSSFKKSYKLSSHDSDSHFRGTKSYEEAEQLLFNGCPKLAKRLNEEVGKAKITSKKVCNRMEYNVCGYQASVPRYLQGIPTNMINSKKVIKKDNVITINKMINYNASFSSETIISESVKLVKLIESIEKGGTRVNLNIIFGSRARNNETKNNHDEVIKIKVKSSGQKLNIATLAFPLCHTSMLRRIIFRYLEVSPTVTDGYIFGYGTPVSQIEFAEKYAGEYTLPLQISYDSIKRIEKDGVSALKEITHFVEK